MNSMPLKRWLSYFLYRLPLLFLMSFFYLHHSQAALDLELTQGITGATPISILPFDGESSLEDDQKLSQIIAADLGISGRFSIVESNENTNRGISSFLTRSRRQQSADYRISGDIQSLTNDLYQVNFRLTDIYGNEKISMAQHYRVNKSDIRRLAHHVSDQIYREITGKQGVFSTQIAYVVKQEQTGEPTRYILAISDYDGYQPQTLLVSPTILMSPTWSPDGKEIAYVSFENNQAQISTINVGTGERNVITQYPGINSSPAYSPDGQQMAVVLSKDGNPKIYRLDLQTKQLQTLTQGSTIDTEPSWASDGKSIVFTSDRGSSPQIYRYDFNTNRATRLTFTGTYNASPHLTPDQRQVVMIHQTRDGRYNIAVQDLQNGDVMPLTYLGFADSPSVAPNGQMVIYSVNERNRQSLRLISIDGAISERIPTIEGEASFPAWSPLNR